MEIRWKAAYTCADFQWILTKHLALFPYTISYSSEFLDSASIAKQAFLEHSITANAVGCVFAPRKMQSKCHKSHSSVWILLRDNNNEMRRLFWLGVSSTKLYSQLNVVPPLFLQQQKINPFTWNSLYIHIYTYAFKIAIIHISNL